MHGLGVKLLADMLVHCAEVFPLYIMAVSGHLFSALLVDMRAPRVPRNPGDMNTSWPYHVANLRAIASFVVNTMLACLDGAGSIYQCSYCGIAWSSTTPKVSHSKQKPKVTLHTPLLGLQGQVPPWLSRIV